MSHFKRDPHQARCSFTVLYGNGWCGGKNLGSSQRKVCCLSQQGKVDSCLVSEYSKGVFISTTLASIWCYINLLPFLLFERTLSKFLWSPFAEIAVVSGAPRGYWWSNNKLVSSSQVTFFKPLLAEGVRVSGEFIGTYNTPQTEELLTKEKETLGCKKQASLKCRKTFLPSFVQIRIELSLAKVRDVSLPNVCT